MQDSPGDGKSCIYLQLAGDAPPDAEVEEDALLSKEVRLVPANADLCKCQAAPR